MTSVAVVGHNGKRLGRHGLPELRKALADAGVGEPLWHEVPKSKYATKQVARAIKGGAGLVIVWGGDGMVQRCVDAAAGSGVALAIIPAGTANLLASNLGIPKDLDAAVDVALHGISVSLDVGVANGERFAVMAGVGFDARMIDAADGALKDRFGRLAYLWTGMKELRVEPVRMTIKLDGSPWFDGEASALLLGNIGTASGGLEIFPDARSDDGLLEVGVVTASGLRQWAPVLLKAKRGSAASSPHVQVSRAARIVVKLREPAPYEIDGGERAATDRLRVTVEPAAVSVMVPRAPAP
ncbi:MAG: diacylglycerol kinase family lipid kinase [Acidobacteria bacterium]|nr:diacylglycerol kinase family lipid kinase [Acidobacteriota bacterium]